MKLPGSAPIWKMARHAATVATAAVLATSPASGRTVLPDGALLAGRVVISGDWAFACSRRICSAIGIPAAYPADRSQFEFQPIIVRLVLIGEPVNERVVRLHLKDENGSLAGTPFGVAASQGPNGIPVPSDQVDGLLQQLGDPAADQLVRRIADGKAVARLPRHGFAWGYAAIQRVLAQRSAAPLDPLDPAIRLDNLVTIGQGKPVPKPSLPVASRATCPAAQEKLTALTHELSNGKRLWEYRCGEASDFGPMSLWFTQDSADAPLEPLILPDPVSQPVNAGQTWLWGTSADAGILLGATAFGSVATNSFSLDCGKRWLWALTGDGFRLIIKQEMPICGTGLKKDKWLITYDTSLSDSPDLDAAAPPDQE